MSVQERLENFANSGAELIAEGCAVIDSDTSYLVVVSMTKRATGQTMAVASAVSDEVPVASRKAPSRGGHAAGAFELVPVDEYADAQVEPADLKGLA